jgi:hypothetical protein
MTTASTAAATPLHEGGDEITGDLVGLELLVPNSGSE